MQEKFVSSTHRRCRRALIALGLMIGVAQPKAASAQVKPRYSRDTVAHPDRRLFTYKDAVLAAAFAGGTILMIPLDRRLALRLQDSATQANRFLKTTTHGVEIVTSPGSYLIGGGLYAIGKIGHFDRLADLGLHGTEAVLFADAVTVLVKGLVGRERPFLTGGKDPDLFHFGQGFTHGDWSSFPSGHTSTAFAAAAAVTNETTLWWPKSTWIIGPLMYGGATSVGLSRMYHSKHWASDVVIGAAVGSFSGRKIWQFTHDHPDNRLDRILLQTTVTPDGYGGARLALAIPIGSTGAR